MTNFLKYVSLGLVLMTISSCSSKKLFVGPDFPELIKTDSISRKYNMQFDFGKKHFSGMLIVRRTSPQEVRLLFTTYFGLSIFDISLREDTFYTNYMIEPLRKKKILSILEMDFKSIFLPNQPLKVKELGMDVIRDTITLPFYGDLFETYRERSVYAKYKIGKGIQKASVYHVEPDPEPESIEIKHTWLRLKIRLDEFNEK